MEVARESRARVVTGRDNPRTPVLFFESAGTRVRGVTSPRSTSGSGMQQTSAGGIARLLLLALSAALATSEVRGCVAWQTCCEVVGGSGGSRSNSVSLRRRDLVFKSLLTGGAIAGLSLGARLRGGAASPRMAVIVDSAVHIWKKDPEFPWSKEAGLPCPRRVLSIAEDVAISRTRKPSCG